MLGATPLEIRMPARGICIKHGDGFGGVSVVCPNAQEALEKLREFEHDGARNIEVSTVDGKRIALEELKQLAATGP